MIGKIRGSSLSRQRVRPLLNNKETTHMNISEWLDEQEAKNVDCVANRIANELVLR